LRLPRLARYPIAAVIVLYCLAPRVAAHPLGTVQVIATFDADGTYRIDFGTDPDALLAKIEALSQKPLSGVLAPAARTARLLALREEFLDLVAPAFDGVHVRPDVSIVNDTPETIANFAMRLSGRVPDSVGDFTWSSSLVFGSYAVVVRRAGSADVHTEWLADRRRSTPVAVDGVDVSSTWQVMARYVTLGFTHILPKGRDHILFVLGIFLLGTKWRPVLLQVTAFTIAHSVTLGFTMYGFVSVSPAIVEPLIALSIAYVAIENLFARHLTHWRLALVFAFGLLHGMGFAGVLGELGLPRAQFLTALASFNLGVEAGQLSVIALAFAAVAWWRRDTAVYRRWVVMPASTCIALMGIYWTVTRIAA
jgi:hypothetical protein